MKLTLDITERIDFAKFVALFWSQALEPAEFKLVFWLIANTVLRGNAYGHYSLSQLVQGVRRRGGGWWCGGAGLSRSTARRALSSLKRRGVIEARPDSRGTEYQVNMEWEFAPGCKFMFATE